MKLKRLICGVLAAACVSGTCVLAETNDEYEAFEQIVSYISQLYIDDTLTIDDIMKNGIANFLKSDPDNLEQLLKATLSSLDDYSEFYTAKEYTDYINNLNKTFYGIGVVIQKKGDYAQIENFVEGSGAKAAGCMIGDKIIKVDGADVKGENVNNVSKLIMGEKGTNVTITIMRGDQLMDVTIMRSEVKGDTVTFKTLSDDIGYINIVSMSITTADEFKNALEEMDALGVKKIVLDLRNNGGGYMVSAIDIAKMIVPKGKICDTVYRNNDGNATYTSNLEQAKYEFNVLVNENTASAAEILASALQDSGAAKLIGDTTYGKAVIQKMYTLVNGSVFKLTTGKYLTRNGKEINQVGIEPDVYEANLRHPIDTKKYTQFDYKEKFDVGMSGESVKAAKERLFILGDYTGAIDDVYNEEMKEAVRQFQERNGLYAYGVMDITTQVKIENVFAALDVIEDMQLKKAFEMFGGVIEEA